jgi:hypothetical protein
VPADYDRDGRADLAMHTAAEYWYIDYSANGFGGFDFVDALGVPVTPKVTLVGHTAHSLKVRVRASGTDLQGHSAAGSIRTSLSGVSNTMKTAYGDSLSREFTNLQSDTEYCVVAMAINSEGSTSRTACFTTDYEEPPPEGPPPTQGVSRVDVFNCTDPGHTLHVWTLDTAAGSSWVEHGSASPIGYGSAGCPGSAAPFSVELQDGHSFWFVVVDPQMSSCGGRNDPTTSQCQKSIFPSPLLGDADGLVVRNVVGP